MNQIPGILPVEKAVILPRFQTKAGEYSMALEQIVFLSAPGNYTVFHLQTGEQVLTSLSLSTYSLLLEKHGFMRLHNRSADAIISFESALFRPMQYSLFFNIDPAFGTSLRDIKTKKSNASKNG